MSFLLQHSSEDCEINYQQRNVKLWLKNIPESSDLINIYNATIPAIPPRCYLKLSHANATEHLGNASAPNNISVKSKRNKASRKSIKCNGCGRSIFRESNLHTITRSRNGSKIFRCGYCGIIPVQKTNFQGQKPFNSRENPLQCKHCNISFLRRGYLLAHMAAHNNDKNKNASDIKN